MEWHFHKETHSAFVMAAAIIVCDIHQFSEAMASSALFLQCLALVPMPKIDH